MKMTLVRIPILTASIEIHAIVVDEVGVLVLVPSTGTKPDLSLFFVDLVNVADDEFAGGNRFHRAGSDIDKVDVPMAILFGEVEDFLAAREPVHSRHAETEGVLGPDEGIGLFIDYVPGLSGEEVEFHDTESLVSPVDLFVAHPPSVHRPAEAGTAEVDQPALWFPVLPPVYIEPV